MKKLTQLFAIGLLGLSSLVAQAQDGKADYPLGAGDTIKVQVFQNPDLTIETRVSESGIITYPLIGAVPLGGPVSYTHLTLPTKRIV